MNYSTTFIIIYNNCRYLLDRLNKQYQNGKTAAAATSAKESHRAREKSSILHGLRIKVRHSDTDGSMWEASSSMEGPSLNALLPVYMS